MTTASSASGNPVEVAPAAGRQLTEQGRERKQQIVESAMALFAERGYAATRISDICERAGVAKGLFYWYFPTKLDLFSELVRSMRQRLRTLQVAHETAAARQEAEIFRLRTQELEVMVAEDDSGALATPTSTANHHLEAFEQLAILTEFRDSETGEHTNRVGDLSAEIAHALGKSPEWCEQLRLAARLHDIGKVAVPDSVLRKTGPLTVEEYEMMKSHTSMGHRILSGNSAPMFQMAAEIAQSHHEWWDGSGYPLGIDRSSIALTGRIVSIADVYDALCSKRPYKRAWARDESARFIVSGRGGQFDPDIVDAFVAVLTARHPELGDELR